MPGDARHQPRQRDDERADDQAPVQIRHAHHPVVARPEPEGRVDEDERDAEGDEEREQERLAERAVQHEVLEQPAERPEERERDRQREERIEVIEGEEPVRGERAEHDELAVGRVQDAADAEDEGESDRRRRVHPALEDAVDERLDEIGQDCHCGSRISTFTGVQ